MTELVVGYANEQQRKDQRRSVADTFVVIDGNATCKAMWVDATKKELAAVFVYMNEKTFNTLEKMMMLRPLTGTGGRLK